jgi:hypothetical protein
MLYLWMPNDAGMDIHPYWLTGNQVEIQDQW